MPRHLQNPVTDEQVVVHYQQSHSAHVTARELGIGSTTVYRILARNDVRCNGLEEWRENTTRFKGREIAIRQAYEKGMTFKQLRSCFGEASDYTFRQVLQRAGHISRGNLAGKKEVDLEELVKIREMAEAGQSLKDMSLELGRSGRRIRKIMLKNDIPMREGGRIIGPEGYILVMVEHDDPMATMRRNSGYVPEHRLNMARKLGRPLRSTETVHHIDGDHTNNHPDNLQLRQGRHGKHIVMRCRSCGSHDIVPDELG